jgi:hypothetical protein
MQQTIIISKDKVPYLLKYVDTIEMIKGYASTNSDRAEITFTYDAAELPLVLIQFFFAGMMYKSDNK